ncbi:MAG TPA: hypothetical protein VFZ20_11640, partial [Longimicrobium sp.]
HAAGAALGLLAGLAMNHPVDTTPLAGEVTPYALSVAWHSPAPVPEEPAAGVQADDWGGRLAEPAARRPAHARTPEARPAPRAPRPAARPSRSRERAPAAPVLRGAELAAATFGVRREECPRERLARLAVQAARAAATEG